MSILALTDNAIFIKNCRERLRIPIIASAALMLFLIISLMFIGTYLNRYTLDGYKYNPQTYTTAHWLCYVFYYLAILQGVLLLLFGTVSANKMAFKERAGGTLDFHRCSPSSRFSQVVGLVIGGPVLEWGLFLSTLPISLCIMFIAKISLISFLIFYISLIVYAVFLHTLAVLFVFPAPQKQGQFGIIPMFFFAWFVFPMMFSLRLSCLYQLSMAPNYVYLWQTIMETSKATQAGDFNNWMMQLDLFFGQHLPFPLLQFIVVLPLVALIYFSITRKISSLENSLFSKTQSIVFFLLILFYYSGSLIPILINTDTADHFRGFSGHTFHLFYFFYLCFFSAFVTAVNVTPSQLSFLKGIRRMKKLGKKSLGAFDDHSSNSVWQCVICSIITFTYLFISRYYEVKHPNHLFFLSILLSQVVFFVSIYEYFRLSVYHQKKMVFWTGIAILWFIIPIFGMVTSPLVTHSEYQQYFCSLSPFFMTAIFTKMVEGNSFIISFPVTLNILLALCASISALYQRRKLLAMEQTK